MTRSISVAKIWDSERKIRSGACCSTKYLRLKTFLLRPSMFHVMAVKEDVGGVTEGEAAGDASTDEVELSEAISLN